MKKPGIIGGIGPESTIAYYRLVIDRFQKKLNTKDYPEMIIHSVNMTEMLDLVFKNRLDELTRFLKERINVLEDAGADFAALASNTPHIVFDRLDASSKMPLVSIVSETCKEIKYKNMQKVALFGTKSTMTAGFYSKEAAIQGIEIIIPKEEDRDFIHEKYMKELIYNNIVPETKTKLVEIVAKLEKEEKIQGLILGGTELPLIIKQSDFSSLEVFDTTSIHVEALVERMIE